LVDLSILEQINEEIEKDNSLDNMSQAEQLKNQNILSSNNETMAKIERERTYVTAEAKSNDNNPYLKKQDTEDKKKRAESYSYQEDKKTDTKSSYNYGYGYSYGNQSTSEKDREEKLNLKAKEYSANVLKKLSEKAAKEIREEKVGGNDWDIFELQRKAQERRKEQKAIKENKGKHDKVDKLKISFLRGSMYACKVALEVLYKMKNR
jgi:hypothetical protein